MSNHFSNCHLNHAINEHRSSMHAQFDNEEGGQNDRHKQARNYLLLMHLYVYPPSNPSIFSQFSYSSSEISLLMGLGYSLSLMSIASVGSSNQTCFTWCTAQSNTQYMIYQFATVTSTATTITPITNHANPGSPRNMSIPPFTLRLIPTTAL